MLQTRFLRDRLQRCRGELSQIIGMARELEQAEEQHAGSGAARPDWQQGGRYAGRAGTFTASSNFGRHESRAVGVLGRIRDAADRCASTLSEVEREIDILTGSGAASGSQSGEPWGRGSSYPSYRDRSAWSTGQWYAPTAAGASVPGAGSAPSRAWGVGAYGSGRMSGWAQEGGDTSGDGANAGSHRTAHTFQRPGLGFTNRGSVPASQQGGYDYGYGAARGQWNGRHPSSAERPLTYAGAVSGQY